MPLEIMAPDSDPGFPGSSVPTNKNPLTRFAYALKNAENPMVIVNNTTPVVPPTSDFIPSQIFGWSDISGSFNEKKKQNQSNNNPLLLIALAVGAYFLI